MGEQLHKRFSIEIAQPYLEWYLDKTIKLSYLLDILGIKMRHFYQLVNRYRTDPEHFSLVFPKKRPPRTIAYELETNILNELTLERAMIEDLKLPIRTYNYSSIQDELSKKYQQKVSLPTIINRAKKNGFYQEKPPKKFIIGKSSPTLPENSSNMIHPITAFHLVSKKNAVSSSASMITAV